MKPTEKLLKPEEEYTVVRDLPCLSRMQKELQRMNWMLKT